jgi:hypothetical protein
MKEKNLLIKIKIDEFNRMCPIGSEVNVTLDSGEVIKSRTLTEAWVVCGSGMVKLDGISGGYDIDRVKPLQEGEK